jgi:hypothetical protein
LEPASGGVGALLWWIAAIVPVCWWVGGGLAGQQVAVSVGWQVVVWQVVRQVAWWGSSPAV